MLRMSVEFFKLFLKIIKYILYKKYCTKNVKSIIP